MGSEDSTVLLTVAGDVKTTSLPATTTVAIATLVPAWAAECSSYDPADLVVLSGDNTTLFDPNDTLADLGLGYGTVLRLVTGDEAMDVLDVPTVTASVDPPTVLSGPDLPAGGPAARWSSSGPDRHVVPGAPGGVTVPPRPSWVAPTGVANGRHVDYGPDERHDNGSSSPPPPASVVYGYDAQAEAVIPHLRVPAQYPGPVFPAEQAQPTAAQGEEAFLPPKVSSVQRLALALKAIVARKAAAGSAQPVGAFGKVAAPPKAAERYRQAMQATDRAHNLELMIRQAVLPHCMVIVVVSPKGGAGKTTITALLGMLFAELRRDPVLAVDANPDFGNLSNKLEVSRSTAAATDEFGVWLTEHPAAPPSELVARLGAGPHGLRYLPTPTGNLERMVLTADFGLYRDLLARLRDYEGIILVDCGTGLLDPPVRAALETADEIVLVTDSSADTAGTVVAAAQYLPQHTPTWLVANKMPVRGAMVDLGHVAAAIPQLSGVIVVPYQHLAENVVTPGFDWAQAPDVWQEPLREVGARLANKWRALR